MSYITGYWTFDPIVIVCAVALVLHEIGLHRLAARAALERTRSRRRRSFLFYGGIALVVVAVDSPIDHWAYDYFFVHMIEHILLMFFAPTLIVLGAPWAPIASSAPGSLRRRVRRALALGRRTAPLRRLWTYLSAPWTALILFNVAMVFWHLPGPFDLAQRTRNVYVWLMQGSFLVTAVLFWLQIIPSRPFRRRAGTAWQIGAIVSTNVVMFVLAMALSIFTNESWYVVYAHVPGVTLSPFADQQIGAAILWICGDFWAVPSLIYVVRSALAQEGNMSNILEELVSRRQSTTRPSIRGPGAWRAEAAPEGAAKASKPVIN